jgi:hypothetical protein
MMKGSILVLIILMSAVFFPALAGGQNAKSITGYENSRSPATDADTKKVEVRMNEALHELIVHRLAVIDKRNASKVSSLSNTSALNSLSTNSSAANSSSINSSMANLPVSSSRALESEGSDNEKASGGTLTENSSADPSGIESNSKADFKGYYGITATQHVMGKNNIDSKTFLSGTFSLDKSVKFQDRGV